MWARVKGRAENGVARLPFKAAYTFRPGVIQPLHGITSRTGWYRAMYVVMGPVMTAMRWIAPSFVLTTEQIGLAMLEVVRRGAPNARAGGRGHQPRCHVGSPWTSLNSWTHGLMDPWTMGVK